MIVTPADKLYFFTGLQTGFSNAITVTNTWKDRLSTTRPSSTKREGYGWIGMVDKMREWVGSRVVHTPAPQTYFVENQIFEQTQGIDKFELRWDQYGIYLPLARMMGEQAAKWPDYQLRDLIENLGSQATTARQTGTDGVTHWSASHPVDFYDAAKGTYINDCGAAGTAVGGITVGGQLAPTAYVTARQEFMSRKSESGERLGITPNVLEVPNQLDIVARTIIQASFFSPKAFYGLTDNVGNVENMLRGQVEVSTNDDLTSAAAWYLYETRRAIKPFIWQQNQAPTWVQRIAENDPVVFDQHTYLYGVEAVGAPAWGLPFLSMRSGV